MIMLVEAQVSLEKIHGSSQVVEGRFAHGEHKSILAGHN
jgi:hypothetical protein